MTSFVTVKVNFLNVTDGILISHFKYSLHFDGTLAEIIKFQPINKTRDGNNQNEINCLYYEPNARCFLAAGRNFIFLIITFKQKSCQMSESGSFYIWTKWSAIKTIVKVLVGIYA